MSKNGKLVVAALAGLIAAAAPLAAHAGDDAGKKVKCEGINACKGKAACKSAKNGCAGQNGCKGQGWVESSEKECKDKGGKVVAADDKKK